jgi:ABC-type amino acid transport substrate-binding protein
MIARYFLLLMLFIGQPSKAEEYNLVSIEGLFEQQVGEIILPEVYKKLGIEITITAMPGKRAIQETVSGRKDGEIMRIWSYGTEHAETIRVPTPYYQLETMAFFKEGTGIDVTSIKDLARYSVLKVRGVKHTNNITSALTNVYDYDDTQSMLRALSTGRDSVALTHTADGLFSIIKFKLEGVMLIDEPLATFPLYHYVHRKNAHLVGQLDQTIKAMKASGELEELIKFAEQKVFNKHGI